MGSFTFPTGTVTVFRQTAAPQGWQKITAVNDFALRVVSGVGGTTGGTVSFSTVHTTTWGLNAVPTSPFPGSTGAAPAASAGLGGHVHTTMFVNPIPRITVIAQNPFPGATVSIRNASPGPTGTDGGGVAHSHPLSVSVGGSATQSGWAVLYADLILASKF